MKTWVQGLEMDGDASNAYASDVHRDQGVRSRRVGKRRVEAHA